MNKSIREYRHDNIIKYIMKNLYLLDLLNITFNLLNYYCF